MRVRPTLQISLGLVFLTSAILIVLDMLFGVFADPDAQLMRLRKSFAESTATQVALLLEQGDQKGLGGALERLRRQDPQIRSIALRRADRTLLAQSGDHRKVWVESGDDASTLTQLIVPLSAGSERWGRIEIAYAPNPRSELLRAIEHPLSVTLIGVVLLGTAVYWQYLRRALVHLDPKAVIPERVRLAFDIMTEGVVVLDTRGRVLLANTAFRELHAAETMDLVGKRLSELNWLAASLPAEPGMHPWMRALSMGRPVMDSAIDVATAPDARKKLVVNCAPITDSSGGVRGCVATFADLTALHLANERLSQALAQLHASRDEIAQKNIELEHMATHDALTGCLTRGAFFECMAQAREDARRTGRPLSCLALDIDKFKSINDGFGHPVGDRVIQEVGRILVSSLRSADIVGRYGGDEFFVGMPGCDTDHGLAVAEKVRGAIEERLSASFVDLPDLRITVSIGVATLRRGDGALDELIERADEALYDAKAKGRNRVAAAIAVA